MLGTAPQHHRSVRFLGFKNMRAQAPNASCPLSIVNSYLLGHAMSRTTVGTLGHGLLCNLTTGPFLTGWLMIAILALMAFFAAEKRRRAHFERFQYSHLLFLPFFGLWQLHGVSGFRARSTMLSADTHRSCRCSA